MLRKFFLVPIILLVVLGLLGCPPGMQITKENLPQTPKEKADYFMGYYLAQKADYKARLATATVTQFDPATGEAKLLWLPTTTKVEKAVLDAKHKFITEGEKPITLYDTYVSRGEVPAMELEIAINSIISRLEQELIKAGAQ